MRWEAQEPPKRRLRVKNKVRFMMFVAVTLMIVAILAVFMPREKGRGNVEYKPYRVTFGDTYWHIAKELQKAGYKPQADIREVVHELVELSGIKAHELKEGDIIYVPCLEVKR